MPYEMYWHIEKRVIGSRFYGEVSAEEISSNGAQIEDYIKEGVQPIFLLVDTRDITQYPTHLKELLEAMGKNPSNSYNLECTIVISSSRFINFIGAMVSNFFKMPIRVCKTMEEGEAFMAYRAAELAPEFESGRESSSSQPS